MNPDNKHDNSNKELENADYDFEMDKNFKESEKDYQQESSKEKQADDSKEEATAQKENPVEGKENVAGEEGSTDNQPDPIIPAHESFSQNHSREDDTNQYSCSYQPPYYTPNFTYPAQTPTVNFEKKKNGIPLWVPIVIAACMLISFVVGGFSGYYFSSKRNVYGPNSQNSSVTIIKNDGSIKVNEKTGSTGYSNLSISEVVDLVADSVVEITTSQVQKDFFYQSYVVSGAGSGVIIGENSERGVSYIITNHHVIENSDSLKIRLASGEELAASVVGSDADSDIAIIQISAVGLTHAVLGKSADLHVGEEVVAIGNPLGELGGTVTDGIISALDRNVVIDGHRMTLLQTNAAINPGNSGGGLFNMAGELIGVVNAKQSDTGIEGLGFAIPIDVAYDVAKDLIDYGYVVGRLVLGFEVVQKTTSFTVNNFYTFNPGIYVSSSKHKNLSQYDRIVSINGKEITQISDYYREIDRLQDGDTLKLVVSRPKSVGFYSTFENVEVEIPITFTKKP